MIEEILSMYPTSNLHLKMQSIAAQGTYNPADSLPGFS